jgi:hypothetical protein
MGIGAIVGMVAVAVLFRAAMAAAGAVTFGAAGVLLAAVWLNGLPHQPQFARAGDIQKIVLVSAHQGATLDAKGAVTVAGQVADRVWGDGLAAWNGLPDEHRLRIVVSGLGAALLGLIVGAIMPRRAAALVTALLGAGVFLTSLTWLARAAQWPGQALLDHGPMGWLAIWLVASAAGLVFQLCSQVRPRPEAKPATT